MDEITSSRRAGTTATADEMKQNIAAENSKTLFSKIQKALYRPAYAPQTKVGPTNWRMRIAALIIAAAVALSATAFVFIGGMRFSCAVGFSGENLGFVASEHQAETVISNVESRASAILGYEYDLSQQASYSLSITGKNTALDSKALERALFDAIPEISKYYTVSVDGVVIGGTESASEAYEVIDGILDSYKPDDAVRAEFAQNVTVSRKDAPTEYLMDTQELYGTFEGKISEEEIDVAVTYSANHLEAIPSEVVYVEDGSMYYDESKVLDEGTEGQIRRTVEFTVVDGKMSSRTLVDNEIITNSTPRTIVVGTAERPVYASTGAYIWPTEGTITSYFGPRSVAVGSSIHKGLDIGAANGTPIYAADGGEIIYSDYMSGYGYLIQIRHDNGEVTFYAHCSRLVGQTGERVARGELIAYVGNTGVSSGSHLHFEVRVNGVAVDPLTVLP